MIKRDLINTTSVLSVDPKFAKMQYRKSGYDSIQWRDSNIIWGILKQTEKAVLVIFADTRFKTWLPKKCLRADVIRSYLNEDGSYSEETESTSCVTSAMIFDHLLAANQDEDLLLRASLIGVLEMPEDEVKEIEELNKLVKWEKDVNNHESL